MTILKWRPLPLGTESDLPPFLVNYDFKLSAYTIMLTDLTYVWTEALDRKKIIQRALGEDASIDPSEGPDQFKLLLQNIQEALEGRQHTSLSIKPVDLGSSITLEVTAPLPHPLEPLKWCMNLSRSAERVLSTEFVLPCLTSLSDARAEVSSLLALIKEKDHVIGRLTDKLEAAGIELADVFPSAAPPKRSKVSARETVISSVRGLKQFNEPKWRDGRALVAERDLRALCTEVFDSASLEMRHLDQDSYEKWLSNGGFNESSGGVKQALTCSEQLPFEQDRMKDDVQKQAMPTVDGGLQSLQQTALGSQYHRGGLQRENSNNVSASTASNDDLDLEPRDVRNRPDSGHSKVEKKIGLLGGRHKSEEASAKPSTNTESSEQEHRKETPVPKAPETLLTTNKSKIRLGKIGGRREVESAASGTVGSIHDSAQRDSPLKDPLPVNREFSRAGRTVKAAVSALPIRETSQERADRKRARLKQELEEKSKEPVKKKRKF